ncbi:anti-apoptotic protein NR13-like [Crassostrea virginica]|uniref:Anti-apoptotic protein NR13-like n=1 Tax=Crassostrea virginica TaxID=6565 RepID=A0A8B8E1E7_CRAVI|nr:anti-apoptotic protein NR13-like [Crassostrea virginica]|mmetsp:Transcript_34683/g.55495  ORF Transcript_34683/g.55495 Transcript_34683/m.55495 type:complete len:227 (-) Transcript_34683:548-1228(-)
MATELENMKNSNGTFIKGNILTKMNRQLAFLPGLAGFGQDMTKLDQETQTPGSTTPMDKVRQMAEVIATDVIASFEESSKAPQNRYCKTMRRTVKEMSDRHNIAFKSMVQKLNVNDTNAFSTFVSVADEIFEDGTINWGRIVAVYTFASRLAAHCKKHSPDSEERIALYAGKYVASKLGKWIHDNGGWDAFSDYFPEQGATEDKLWKGLMFTAVGLVTLGTMVARS